MDELGGRLAAGDPEAFADLYDAWADRLYHYALVRLGSPEAAADVVQETFLRLVAARDRLRNVANVPAYLFRIARNESSRLDRRRRRDAQRREMLAQQLFVEATAGPAETAELAELVSHLLARLTPDQRELVELKVYAGLTFREIAEVTGLAQGTAATRYRAAITRLRQWMQRALR